MSFARERLSTLRPVRAVGYQPAKEAALTVQGRRGDLYVRVASLQEAASWVVPLKDLLEKLSYRDRKQIVVAWDVEGLVPSEHKGSWG